MGEDALIRVLDSIGYEKYKEVLHGAGIKTLKDLSFIGCADDLPKQLPSPVRAQLASHAAAAATAAALDESGNSQAERTMTGTGGGGTALPSFEF